MMDASALSSAPSRHQAFLLTLFSFSLFLSAGLLFMIQPMLGKLLLPRIGGTPAGWVTALAFFQTMLLLGYLLAHFLSHLTPRRHGAVFIVFLLAGCFFLPVHLPMIDNAEAANPFSVFYLLLHAVGAPFVALSATAATLQRLFAASGHRQAKDPYFLYAASNGGSLAGLFLYPLLIEPLSTVDTQALGWSSFYILFICGAAVATAMTQNTPPRSSEAENTQAASKTNWRWVAFSFLPSALLLAVTTHITTDIISAPMVWVVPLGLYLLTFIMAFARRQIIPLRITRAATPALIVISLMQVLIFDGTVSASWFSISLHLAAFTMIALFFHQQLVETRPPSIDLTRFYLLVAVGGALGGMVNAFAMPYLTDRLVEYPLFLLLAAVLHPAFKGMKPFRYARVALFILFTVAFGVLWLYAPQVSHNTAHPALWLPVAAAASWMALLHPTSTLVLTLLIFFQLRIVHAPEHTVLRERNFFGVLRVSEKQVTDAAGTLYTLREMSHGTTMHGSQIIEPASMAQEPTSYFHRNSPVADVLATESAKNIAVIGLGIGTLACHQASGRHFTFFEINPAVTRIAQDNFSFLSRCTGAQPHRMIAGDGRLALARLIDDRFNVIIMDAFSSDSVPAHLVTIEAIESYLERLAPDGILAFNMSNRYLDLTPVLAANAQTLGLAARMRTDDTPDAPYRLQSAWFVMTPSQTTARHFSTEYQWHIPNTAVNIRPWHDNHHHLLGILK